MRGGLESSPYTNGVTVDTHHFQSASRDNGESLFLVDGVL